VAPPTSLVGVHADPRRLRPAELLALVAGVLLAVSLFLPWYEFPSGRESAWSAVTISAVVPALAALLALALVAVTLGQRSPALPVALATFAIVVGLAAVAVVAVRSLALPGGATDRCYGLWLGLAGAVGVTVAAFMALRDESPFWGVRAAG
jgi:ABC-type Na+ efflux pump permease subunit